MIGNDLSKAVLSRSTRQVSVVIDGVKHRPVHIEDVTQSDRLLQFAKLMTALHAVSACVTFGLKDSEVPGHFIGIISWTPMMDSDHLPAIAQALEATHLQVMWPQ